LFEKPAPGRFTLITVTGELSLALVALLVDRLWPGPGLPPLDPSPRALALGALGAVPPVLILFGMLTAGDGLPFLKRIHDVLHQMAGPTIAALRWWQIALIALSAGIGEEALFRGVLLARLGNVPVALIFGLLHALTPSYAVLAAVFGFYLGWLELLLPSLLVPIITHALYDLVALWIFARLLRTQAPGPPDDQLPLG
jgi:CAAX protease family protein